MPRPAFPDTLDIPAAPPARTSPRSTPTPAAPRARRAPVRTRETPRPEAPARSEAPVAVKPVAARPASRPAARPAPRPARPAERAPRPLAAPDLAWPESFDDWMIDIVRRRALRLNSGARRRGVHGAVRAAELAHILERSKDEQGRWRCALCQGTVTLADLSFDHVVALADGGEHAAYNLVPAHRKCNEIKGSEKAQYRAQALDRWLSEWAVTHGGATPRGVTRHHTPTPHDETPHDEAPERRLA